MNNKINMSNIKIQSLWRGYNIRKKNKVLHDSFTYDILITCIDQYQNVIKNEKNINTNLKKKKIRLSNFPSHISENIAKFAIYNKYNIMPTWDTDKGDLFLPVVNKQLEIKGSINLNNGPPTFGPTEEWDYLYFVDGVDNHNKKYKVYEVKLSNKSTTWRNLKVSKSQTFYDQCLQKRRPRLKFNEIQKQLGDKCQLIFDGHISKLKNII